MFTPCLSENRDEIFFSSLPYFFSLSWLKKKHSPPSPFLTTDTIPLVHDPLIKKNPSSWWWTKVRRPFAWTFVRLFDPVPPTSTQQPPSSKPRLIIYPSRFWITPTVGRTQLINSPVAIHLFNFAQTSYFPSITTFFVPLERISSL